MLSGLKQKEIVAKIGISQQQVSRLEQNIKGKFMIQEEG